MCNVYVKNVPKVEGMQFDGENGDAIVEFVGGEDYGKVSGDELILTPAGKDPRGNKITVTRGQFVIKSQTSGTSVVNEGEMLANFTNLDGTLIEAIAPDPPADPVAEDELVYQPGFGPLTEEDKKKAEEKVAADKKKAAADERKRKLTKRRLSTTQKRSGNGDRVILRSRTKLNELRADRVKSLRRAKQLGEKLWNRLLQASLEARQVSCRWA